MNGTSLEARVEQLEIKLAARDAWLGQLHMATDRIAEMMGEAKKDTLDQVEQTERILRVLARIEESLREEGEK